MKIISNYQMQNPKQNFTSLVGKLPDELSRYSDEFMHYAEDSLANWTFGDIDLVKIMGKDGRTERIIMRPQKYPFNNLKITRRVSGIGSCDDLKLILEAIKTRVGKFAITDSIFTNFVCKVDKN